MFGRLGSTLVAAEQMAAGGRYQSYNDVYIQRRLGGYGGGGVIDAPLVGLFLGIPLFSVYFGMLINTVPKRYGHGLRQRIRTWYPNSLWNPVTEGVNGTFSLISSILLIIETYTISQSFLRWSYSMDSFVTVFFSFNFIYLWYIATSTRSYLTSSHAIIDIITIVPSLLAIPLGYGNKAVRLYKILRVFRLFRIIRVYDMLVGLSSLRNGPVRRTQAGAVKAQFTFMVFTIVVILFVLAGLVNAMVVEENSDWGLGHGVMPFHDAMYYCVVTFGTVGYGDISPSTTAGRVVISALICGAFIYVPVQTSKLIYLISIRPKYSGDAPKNKARRHVIIGCDVNCCERVRVLLNEFFSDVYVEQRHVVVVVPADPSAFEQYPWNGIIVQWVQKLTFLKGDLRNPTDLARAYAQDADACFIVTNSMSADPLKDDKVAFMRAITVHEFNPFIKLYTLVTYAETRRQLVSMGLEPSSVISNNEIMQKVVAQTCVNAGMSTIVANVMTQAPDILEAVDLIKKRANELPPHSILWNLVYPYKAIKRKRYLRLMRGVHLKDAEVEYMCSIGNVIVLYDQLGVAFQGTSVQNVALNIYDSCGAVLVAVVKRYDKDGNNPWGEMSDPNRRGAILYPGCDYYMEKDDVGYFLATSRADTVKISAACVAHMDLTGEKLPADSEGRGGGDGGGTAGRLPLARARGSAVYLLSPQRGVQDNDNDDGVRGWPSGDVLGLGAATTNVVNAAVGVFGGFKNLANAPRERLGLGGGSPRSGMVSRKSTHLSTSQMKAITGIAWALPPEVPLPDGHIVVIGTSVASVWGLVKKLSEQREASGPHTGRKKRIVLLCKVISSHHHEARRLEKAIKDAPAFDRVTIVTGPLDDVQLSKAKIPLACLVCISSAVERHAAAAPGFGAVIHQDSEDRDAMTVRILGEVLSIAGTSVRVVCDINLTATAEQHQVLTSRVRRLWMEQLCSLKGAAGGSRASTLASTLTTSAGAPSMGSHGVGADPTLDASQPAHVARGANTLFRQQTAANVSASPARPAPPVVEDMDASLHSRRTALKSKHTSTLPSLEKLVGDDSPGSVIKSPKKSAVTDGPEPNNPSWREADSMRSIDTIDSDSKRSIRGLTLTRSMGKRWTGKTGPLGEGTTSARDEMSLRRTINNTLMEYFRVRPPQPKPVFFNHMSLKSGFTNGDVVMADLAELLMLQTYLAGNEDNITEGSYIHAQLSEVVARLLEPPAEVYKKGIDDIDQTIDMSTTSTTGFGRTAVIRAEPQFMGRGGEGGADIYQSTLFHSTSSGASRPPAPHAGPGGLMGAAGDHRKLYIPSPPTMRRKTLTDFSTFLDDDNDTAAVGSPIIMEHAPSHKAYVKKIMVPEDFFEQAREDVPTFGELFNWLLETYDVVSLGIQRFFPLDDSVSAILKYGADGTAEPATKTGGGAGGIVRTASSTNVNVYSSRSIKAGRTFSGVNVRAGEPNLIVANNNQGGSNLRPLPPAAPAPSLSRLHSSSMASKLKVASKNALRDHLCINCPRKSMEIERTDNVFVIAPHREDDDDNDDDNDDDGEDDTGGGDDGDDDQTIMANTVGHMGSLLETVDEAKKHMEDESSGLGVKEQSGGGGGGGGDGALALHQWALKAFMWKRELSSVAAAGGSTDELKMNNLKELIAQMPAAYPCQHCKRNYRSPPVMSSCGHLMCSDCLAAVLGKKERNATEEGGDFKQEGGGEEPVSSAATAGAGGFSCPFCQEAVSFTVTLNESLT